MFEFSFAEMSLIMLVALLLIGPEELPGIIRNIRNFKKKSQRMLKEVTNSLLDVEDADSLKNEFNKLNDDIKKIVDLEGNLQETYDISDIIPESSAVRNSKSKETSQK
jgi:sec-independent protein translocase protein TatB